MRLALAFILLLSPLVSSLASEAPAKPSAKDQKSEVSADEPASALSPEQKAAIQAVNKKEKDDPKSAVLCQSKRQLGSRIKRNHCMTIRQWEHEMDEKILRAGHQLKMEPRETTKK